MAALEILAIIFSILILLKIIIIFIRPNLMMKFAAKLMQNSTLLYVLYLIVAIIIGYYLSLNLSIIQIAAVMFFTSFLFGISMIPYLRKAFDAKMGMMQTRSEIIKHFWLSILIWLAIAIITLYKVFFLK